MDPKEFYKKLLPKLEALKIEQEKEESKEKRLKSKLEQCEMGSSVASGPALTSRSYHNLRGN